jgi:hypothetical protein
MNAPCHLHAERRERASIIGRAMLCPILGRVGQPPPKVPVETALHGAGALLCSSGSFPAAECPQHIGDQMWGTLPESDYGYDKEYEQGRQGDIGGHAAAP